MKFIYKLLIGIGILIVLYFSVISVISIYYRKEIEIRVVSEINKNLSKPISIGRISISAFTNFPSVSFRMDELLVHKSDSNTTPLLKLQKLQILFSPYNILIKNFKVDDVLIANGYFDARVDSLGNRDFDIVVKKDTTKIDKEGISNFNFKKIKFKNIHVFYDNKFKPKRVEVTFKDTESSLSLDAKMLTGNLVGNMFSKEITLKPGTLLGNSDFQANFNFTFDQTTKVFAFDNSVLSSKGNSFLGKGNIDFKNNSFLTLNIKTTNADIKEVFRLIPQKWTDKIKILKASGNIDADATIKISLLPGNQPIFDIDFSTSNFSIQPEKLPASIHNIHFKGNLNSSSSIKMEDYEIQFTNLRATVNTSDSIKADSIVIHNFIDPTLKTTINLNVNSKTLFDIIRFKNYTTVGGIVHAQLNYDGKLNYLFGKSSEMPIMAGYIDLKNMNLKLTKVHFAFDELNGRINFKNDTIQIDDLAIKSGKTDMTISGTANHLFNSIFNDTTGLDLKINFESDNFYFSDFNSLGQKSNKGKVKKANFVENNNFVLPYDLKAVFKGKVKNFYARHYQGNNIDLEMKLSKKNIIMRESMNSFGGQMNFISNFAPVKNEIHCKALIAMRKFNIDKIFLSFNNFNQKMLNSDNVKGMISGDIHTFFKMNNKLVLDTNSIFINGTYTVNKLELNNVEPLMILTKVGFDENDLKRVVFEKIESSITVKNHEVIIPRTLFVSNILYFYLEVLVKADGESNFYVLLPVKNMKKQPNTKDLTNDSKVGLSIPLKITGKAGKLKAN